MEEVKNKYVVYGHYYNDELFYVGSGAYYGGDISKSRAYNFRKGQRSKNWFDFCKGETEKIKVEILFETNDQKLALDKEVEITRIYIEKGFPLVNKRYGNYMTEEEKRAFSEARKGEGNPQWGKTGKDCHNYGRKHSAETKRKISLANKGKTPNNAKKVLITDNLTSESKIFNSITQVHEFISQRGFDKTKTTLQNYLNKGVYNFKEYTMELLK